MKKIHLRVLAATLVCGLTTVCLSLNSCKEANAQDVPPTPQVQSTELIRTSQSWDGVELPDYLQGRPVMNYGILVQGELTIIGLDGKTKVVHEGEPVVEMVNTIHHGENNGDKDVILYMFYLSQKDSLLAVQHPEIPLE